MVGTIKFLLTVIGAIIAGLVIWAITEGGMFCFRNIESFQATVRCLYSSLPQEKIPFLTPPLDPGFDFIQQASAAEWSNGSRDLPFPGNRADRNGFVYFGSFEELEDGNKAISFLQTHPEWQSYGAIKGKYGPFKIQENVLGRFQVGFLKGASGSDGVVFKVAFEDSNSTEIIPLGQQPAHYDGQMNNFVIDFRPISGQVGHILLSVSAAGSAAQDWAVWNFAKVVSN